MLNTKNLLSISFVLSSMISTSFASDPQSTISEFRKMREAQFHRMLEEVDAMDHSSEQYKQQKAMVELYGREWGFRAKGDDSNRIPEAYVSYSKAVLTDSVVDVSGWASNDWNDDPLTYRWSFTHKPEKSRARFSDTTVMAPTFVPDVQGEYKIQLVVSDGQAESEPYAVSIISNNGHAYLPDDPGEAGKQTLSGIDTDNDGIRDDIQRHLFATYPADNQKSIRFILGEMAYHNTNALKNTSDPEFAYAYSHRNDQYQFCLDQIAGAEADTMSKTMIAELLNTEERATAWIQYQQNQYGYQYTMILNRINDGFCSDIQSGVALPDIAAVVMTAKAKKHDQDHPPLVLVGTEMDGNGKRTTYYIDGHTGKRIDKPVQQ